MLYEVINFFEKYFKYNNVIWTRKKGSIIYAVKVLVSWSAPCERKQVSQTWGQFSALHTDRYVKEFICCKITCSKPLEEFSADEISREIFV